MLLEVFLTPTHPSGREVFEILARENADMLSAYLRSLLGADSSLDDVYQETMVVAWRRLAEYDRTRAFGPWLRGIARNLVLEHHRRGRVRAAAAADLGVLAELDARYDGFVKPGESFVENAERVRRCMGRLPEVMKDAIEMVYVRGMLLKQIASAIGAAEETVKKRVQRARTVLADCLRSSEVTS